MTSALGLVAGLAWNEAAKSFIEYLLPVSVNTLFAKFGYAIFITIITVIISAWMMRVISSEDNK